MPQNLKHFVGVSAASQYPHSRSPGAGRAARGSGGGCGRSLHCQQGQKTLSCQAMVSLKEEGCQLLGLFPALQEATLMAELEPGPRNCQHRGRVLGFVPALGSVRRLSGIYIYPRK